VLSGEGSGVDGPPAAGRIAARATAASVGGGLHAGNASAASAAVRASGFTPITVPG